MYLKHKRTGFRVLDLVEVVETMCRLVLASDNVKNTREVPRKYGCIKTLLRHTWSL